jgi:hypothetical protein
MQSGGALVPNGQILASNVHEHEHPERLELSGPWEDREALADVVFVAGVLGLLAGLPAVLRLSADHFPDAWFWSALPLLLVVPSACFLGALLAPGGVLDGTWAAWPRAVRLGLGGLAGYVVPVVSLSLAAAIACLR